MRGCKKKRPLLVAYDLISLTESIAYMSVKQTTYQRVKMLSANSFTQPVDQENGYKQFSKQQHYYYTFDSKIL